MLSGCGGSQPPIGAPGTMLQSHAIATHAERGKSWMLPEAKNEDLLYATGGCGGTCVISYPKGKVVGSLTVGGPGACVDGNGNVFIADNESVVEYAHGGSSPIATLNLPGDSAGECSVDPTTGNLAVLFVGKDVGIAIFPDAQGTPTTYSAGIDGLGCGYDNKGDLFVSGYNGQDPGLSELTAGGTQFSVLNISDKVGNPGSIQWDGSYMSYEGLNKGEVTASQLSVSGSAATVVGVSHFDGIPRFAYFSWIHNGKIVIPFGRAHGRAPYIGLWKYPSGGKPDHVYRKIGSLASFQAVTLSLESQARRQ
jgi:hypothetical protein